MLFFFMLLCCHAESFLTSPPVEVLLSKGCMRCMFLAQWETPHYLRGSPLAHLKGRILFNRSEDASQPPPPLSCSCLLLAFAIVKMSSISNPAPSSPHACSAQELSALSHVTEKKDVYRGIVVLQRFSVFLFDELKTDWWCVEYQANFFLLF